MRARLTAACLGLLLLAALPVAPTAGAGGGPAPGAWGDACSSEALGLDRVEVQIAPPLASERNPDGSSVKIKPDRRGRYTPVVLVHGWTGTATHTANGKGAFSHPIDLTTNRLVPARTTRSLIGQLQRIEGTAVYTYDYHPYSGRWVDDAHLGPGLGAVVDCLYRASGEQVIVVGHSMGGLVARWMAGRDGRAARISRVLTFGTPEQGSLLARAISLGADVGAAADKRVAVLRLLLSACGQQSSVDVETGSLCDALPAFARAFDSQAGQALRIGSPQLKALPSFPRGTLVDALAGDMSIQVPTTWFGLSLWPDLPVHVGDGIVLPDSAQHAMSMGQRSSCAYTLNLTRAAGDAVLVRFGLVSTADAAVPPTSLHSSCFHTDLMRDIGLTNAAVSSVASDVAARQPLTVDDLMTAPVPAACRHRAGTLTGGRLLGLRKHAGFMQLGRLGDRAALARTLAFGDLDGDGRSDAATVLSCNAGGVPWGELIAFYTRDRTTGGIRLLGSVELSKVTVPAGADGMGRAYVSAVRYRDGGVDVTWTSNQNDDCGGCLTLDYRGTLRWDGRRIMPSRLTGTTEVPTARTFVAALRSGDLAAAGRVAQPAAVQAGAGLLAAYPAARQAPLNCSSYNGLLFAPKPLADETLAGTLPQGDRYCTIQADAESYLVVVMRHQGFESWRVASVLVVSSQVGGD